MIQLASVAAGGFSMSDLDNLFTENTFGDLSYTFREPVPNYLTCIICLGLLKDAVATDCCGKMFCSQHSSCTEACPACRHAPLGLTRNKGVDGIVEDLKVFCLHHKEGCPWSGHLCFEPDHRNSTCEFKLISCEKGCGADMQRRRMECHLLEDCPQRAVKCEFCKLSVTAAELKTHHESCPEYPIECPHGCHLSLPRKEVEEHSSTCPEVPVPCPFTAAGCKQCVKNKELAIHVQAFIMDQAAVKLERLDIQSELNLMKDGFREVSRDLCTATTHVRELQESVAQLKQSVQSHWRRYLVHASAVRSQKLPMIFSYSKLVEDLEYGSSGKYSPSFYTSDNGYHLRLVVFPDGIKHGWMSVNVIILPGDHDDNLRWLMQGSLKVEVLNQLGDYNHHSKDIDFLRFPRKFRERALLDPSRNDHGWGILRFMCHRDLLAEVDDHRYVLDGTTYFRVTRSS